MTTYNIHFINKFSSTSKSQDYAFFSELPKLSHNPTCSPIYSNVFKSTTLQRGQAWSIGLTPNVYAWCGTADRKLGDAARVELSMSKLATIGTEGASGSTFKMSNVAGRPRFAARTSHSANDGAFAIETANDFNASSNFVVGLAAIDDEGRFKPLATMNAASNATVNVMPSSKFYLAAHSSAIGDVVDTTVASRNAATIDFSKNVGTYGAIITHETNGGFSVKYTNQTDFDAEVEEVSVLPPVVEAVDATTENDARDAELIRLREQLKQMELLLVATLKQKAPAITSAVATPVATPVPTTGNANSTATPASVTALVNDVTPSSTPDPYPGKPQTTWYKATLPFRNSPGQSRRRDIRDRLTNYMQTLGYTYEGGTIDSSFVAIFSHHAGTYGNWHSVYKAALDFKNVYEALPRHLKGYIGSAEEFSVTRTTESKGLWRARGETESRVNDYGTAATITNGVDGIHRSVSPTNGPPRTPINPSPVNGINGVRHERTPSRKSSKHLTNGVNGANGVHHERTPSKPLANGINGIHHERTPSKPLANGVKPVNTADGVNGKYDYKRGPDTHIEAAKRHARAVLRAEGLDEYAVGWTVSGYQT